MKGWLKLMTAWYKLKNKGFVITTYVRRQNFLEAGQQTIFVGNIIIPVVLVTALRSEAFYFDTVLILLPLQGALFTLCILTSRVYFCVKLFAYSLNETSMSVEKGHTIVFFCVLYILILLLQQDNVGQ
mmetsp:Transcript_5995/g.6869  ORF Transcript_5995/g.6869 Transcript_5995/m.6869 type:complete len:128 (-) Transcript_5995:1076-1459(-)